MRNNFFLPFFLWLSAGFFTPSFSQSQAWTDLSRGEELMNGRAFEDAIICFREAASRFESDQQWQAYYQCLNHQANCFYRTGDLESMEAAARKVISSSGLHLGENNKAKSLAYKQLGNLSLFKAEQAAAADRYTKALDILEKIDEDVREEKADLYSNLGIVYRRIGDYENSLENNKKALQLRLEVYEKTHPRIATSYNNLGNLYSNMGRYRSALEYYQKGVEVLKSQPEDLQLQLANNYVNMGELYWQLGSYDLALRYVETAKNVFVGGPWEYRQLAAQSYVILGNIYHSRKEYNKSIEYNEKALNILDTLLQEPYSFMTAVALNNLGACKKQIGMNEEALAHLHQALFIIKENLGETHPKVADCLFTLGEVYEQSGDQENAWSCYQECRQIREAALGEHHPDLASIYNRIALFQMDKKQYGQALGYLDRALAANTLSQEESEERAGFFFDYMDLNELLLTLFSKARTKAMSEDTESAYNLYQGCDEVIELIRRNHFELEDKINFNQTALSVYEQAILNCLQLYRQTSEGSYLEQGFTYAEKSKANTLLQSMAADQALEVTELPDSLIEKERSLKLNMSFFQKVWYEAIEAGEPQKVALYQARLLDTKREYQELINELEEGYPQYFQLKYDNQVTGLSEIRKSLPEKTALLEYFTGEENIVLFYIDAEHFEVRAFEKNMTFDSSVERFRKATAVPEFVLRADSAAQVYEMFVDHAHGLFQYLLEQPLARVDWQNNTHLIIVPDGKLAYLPFDILLKTRPERGSGLHYRNLDYLLRSHATSYAISATLWLSSQRRAISLNQYPFVGFAPEYKPRFAGSPDTTLAAAPVSAADISYEKHQLRDLPNARSSLEEIAGLFPKGALPFLGADATESRFKAVASDYQILHFAMHGVLNDREPLLSYLAFTRSGDTIEDDLLYAMELYDMDLNAQLAVLSACNTGLGEIRRGEGMMSLSRAFTFAGCPALLVSLWSIPELETGSLMVDFYQFLRTGKDKAQAIRQAKLSYLDDPGLLPNRSHPLYWAGLVPVGDIRPLNISGRSWYWYLAGGGILLAGVFFWGRKK